MLKIVALCIAILVVAGCLPQLPYPMSQAMQPCPRGSYCLNEFSLSPDGRWVAFAAQGGICLFDWRSRNFRKIPNPEGGYAPTFSPDGRHIVAVVRTKRIAIIDVSASQVTRTFDASEKYEWIDGRPVFQPSTGKILFVAAGPGVWNHFRLLDATDGTTTTLVEANDGFHGIFTPSFIGDDGVIFAGMGPQNPNLAQEVHAYLLHPITDWLAYEYRLGGKATTALPEIYAHSLRTNPNTSGVTNLLASRDGKTVVWIDLSSTDPNLKAKFNYEIFKLENGTITQMTNLRTHMAGLALSYDGSTVAFGSDPSRNKADADLFVLELATGAIHPMGLVERMRARPDCVNHDLGSEYTRNPKNAGA